MFQKALAFCIKKKREIGYFVVHRFDRFARNAGDHLGIKTALRKSGIEILSATQGTGEASAESDLMETVIAGVAEYESKTIGIRARAGMLEARRSGRLSGPAPIGYLNIKPGLGPNRVEIDSVLATYIKQAFSLFTSTNLSQCEIADKLNTMGYVSRRGKKLSLQQLSKILRTRTYAGFVFVDEDEGWVPSEFEAIIEPEIFELAQRRLNRELPAQAKQHKCDREDFPLKRFVRCGSCGKPMSASRSRGKGSTQYPYYHCFRKACKSIVRVRAELLEEQFVSLLERLVPTIEFERFFLQASHEAYSLRLDAARSEEKLIKRRLDKAMLRRQKLIDLRLDDGIQDDVYYEQYDRLQSQIEALEMQRLEASSVQAQVHGILNKAVYQLRNAANLWITSNMRTRQALQTALFPDGLEYHTEGGFRTPATPKGFNYLELLETPEKELAGLLSSTWNPCVEWLRDVAHIQRTSLHSTI